MFYPKILLTHKGAFFILPATERKFFSYSQIKHIGVDQGLDRSKKRRRSMLVHD